VIPALLLFAAAPFQDTAAIDRAVSAFTTHGIGAEGGARTAVDTRLRLASCPMVSLAWRTEAHDAVTVTCSGPDWRLYVPVVRAPGSIVAAPGIAAAPAARAAPVIRRGDPVLVEAGTDGFSVTREGVAMGDAAPGGRFLVKVEDAKGPVQAMATPDGRAVLPGWSQ
jgi:flagella basal body P-ring formation protein FlgA